MSHFLFAVPDSSTNAITCEVLVARPYERLIYRWTYRRAELPTRLIVDWTLRPEGHGTRLRLTQTGFDIDDRRQKMVRNAAERSWKRRILPQLGPSFRLRSTNVALEEEVCHSQYRE
ncbi:SRPBCC domain-containing protein [Nocardia sp. NPDC057455]|uniref:SRPBCC family protein n=1 Tax=Nocardia sp. NPDC057455 TaxID=3346138 RepID=UPI00366D7944